METPQNELSYFQKRMQLLGITPENNIIKVKETCINYVKNAEGKQVPGKGHGETILIEREIFTECDKGIEIFPYYLSRNFIQFSKNKDGKRERSKKFSIIRLEHEIVKPDGSKQKYIIPKGEGTPPFIPPSIIDLYEAKAEIETLYITEGYFKAFKAHLHGLHCIGLISITCMVDKSTGKLHGDILEIINQCKVKRLVWLTDADCRQITKDEITTDKDLYTRVFSFYNSIQKFQDLTSNLEDTKVYFAHINEFLEGNPKGLDDLLIEFPNDTSEIVSDANAFDSIQNNRTEGRFFTKFYISTGTSKVWRYFMLNDVTAFYLHHIEIRKDLKDKKFRFHGTLYSYNDKDGKCVIEIPKDAAFYFRVGDTYYEHVKIPNRYGELTQTYHARQKSTINEDCGKDIFKHIAKYKAFCNVPDHNNYQRVIDNCFNVYHPFLHVPEDGDFTITLDYLKHIFGENEIILSDGTSVKNYELGLDYLTILYRNPQQILPILCLVSEDRNTGKSTFVKWLKILFTENAAIIGNQDFENGFNAHWTSKLLVCVDETKIDKDYVIEKIKSLSTANHTMMNAKGKDQVEMEVFMKFILLSNNERNFINIDPKEVRFWVIKVPTITKLVMELEKEMQHEIPAFLNYLNTRKMVTSNEFRHWFNPKYLVTDTLLKIQENSAPSLWKLIKSRITIMFEDFDLQEIPLTAHLIKTELLKGYKNYEDNYIKDVLKQQGYELSTVRRGFFYKKVEVTGKDDPTDKSNDLLDSDNISFRTQRINVHGRCYEFKRENFTTLPMQSTQLEIKVDPQPANELTADEIPQDLPF